MKNKLAIFLFIAYIGFALASCGSDKPKVEVTTEDKSSNAEKAEAEESLEYVELTDEQMKAIGVQLGTIEQRPITSSIKVNGVLEVPNQYKATVTSIFAGSLRTLSIRPGMFVRKGQTIATIANPDLISVQQQYLTVNTRIQMAELEYERQKTLVAGNAGARKNLQQAETELRTLRTERTALQKQLSTLGISPSRVAAGNITSTLSVPAPVSGTVSRVNAQIGAYIDASTVIADIVNNDQLQVKLLLYEKDLPHVRVNQNIQFTVTNNPTVQYVAVVNSIGTAFEEGTTTVPVRAAIKRNKSGLIEGMNVTAMLSIDNSTVPAVPNDAIVSYQGQDYIFIRSDEIEKEKTEQKPATKQEPTDEVHGGKEESKQEKGIRFKLTKVVKGASSMGYTEIKLLEEVPANALVITKGAFFALGKMTNAGEEGE